MNTVIKFEQDVYAKLIENYPNCTIDYKQSNDDTIVLRLPLHTKDDAEAFKNNISSIMDIEWIVYNTRSQFHRVIFGKTWVCQHGSKNKEKSINSKRNSNCQAKLKICIKKVNKYTCRNDKFLNYHPPLAAKVLIGMKHLHSTDSEETLRMLRVNDKLEEKKSLGERGWGALRFQEPSPACATATPLKNHHICIRMDDNKSERIFECALCQNHFSRLFCLKRHLKVVHYIEERKTLKEGEIWKEFSDFDEFSAWKMQQERETHSMYIRKSGNSRRKNGNQMLHYYCNRSGVYNPKGKGLRTLKSQGSSKIGTICPARMTVKITSEKVITQFFSKHENHEMELKHLRLSKSERAAIAGDACKK